MVENILGIAYLGVGFCISATPYFMRAYYRALYADKHHIPDKYDEATAWTLYAMFWPILFPVLTFPKWIGRYIGKRARQRIQAAQDRERLLNEPIEKLLK